MVNVSVRPLRRRLAAVEDLSHDLVANLELVTGNYRVSGRDAQFHEGRRSRRLAGGLAQLCDLIQLPDGRERNHQGLDNRLLQHAPLPKRGATNVQRRGRLGGLLNFYYREAA